MQLLGASCVTNAGQRGKNMKYGYIAFYPEQGKNAFVVVIVSGQGYVLPIEWKNNNIVSIKLDNLWHSPDVRVECYGGTWVLEVKIGDQWFKSEPKFGGPYVHGDTLCAYLAGACTAGGICYIADYGWWSSIWGGIGMLRLPT